MAVPALASVPDLEFCLRLPKVELHAHLSGSVSRSALQSIYDALPASASARALPAPNDALADEKRAGQSIDTFFGHFHKYTYHLISSIPSLRFVTRSVLHDFADDGVTYLELRTTPRPLSDEVSAKDGILAVLDEIHRWNAGSVHDPVQELPLPPWHTASTRRVSSPPHRMIAALLLSVNRLHHKLSAAEDIVDLALELRAAGHPVVGLDLSGDPSSPTPVAALAPAFRRARAAGMKLALHFAELPASSSEGELEELLSWKPRRLGHCIYVTAAMRRAISQSEGETRLGVEQCISCNVLAGMLPPDAGGGGPRTPETHPFRDWLAEGAEVSLGTDDIGVFRSPSSREHMLAATAVGLSRLDLVRLCWQAMEGAFCDEEQKQRVKNAIAAFARAEDLADALG